ncbi:Cytochrome b-c1 complex subunit 2, mitochondrial, partial [Geodia barretti]
IRTACFSVRKKMASFVLRRAAGRLAPNSLQRWASAAAVPLTESLPYYEGAEPDSRKPPEGVKVHLTSHRSKRQVSDFFDQVTKLSNGVTVASLETHSFSSTLSVYVRAGSRFETYSQQGLSHLLKKAAFLAAGGRSTFRVFREIDHVGGSLSAANTREHVVYRAQLLRGNEDLALDILSKAVVSPDLRDWEIQDLTPRLALEVTAHEDDPESSITETLHGTAFRNALGNSVLTPRFNLGHVTASDLRAYMDEWFVGRRITLVGIGVDHQELVSRAESSFSSVREGPSSDEETCHYCGGGEVHVPSRSGLTHAAIVSKREPVSLSSEQDVLLAGVLQACALNFSYSDNGLFGFYVVSEPQNAGRLLQAVMQEFSSVAKGDVSDADLTRAKNQLKARYLMGVEQSTSLSDSIAAQLTQNGDYTPLTTTNQKVDAITKDAIVQFAKSVFATRSTFVARGNLSATPRMQQLLEGVSLR